MTKVLFLPEIVDQFLKLADILHGCGYFAFKDSAIEYAESLFKDIQSNLPIKVRKEAPEYFDQYGKGLYYSLYPKTKQTTWYVFYTVHKVGDDLVYLVRYLGNNHTISQHLISNEY